MRLAVLGATGRTGRHVVRRALARGDEVVALERRAGQLDATPGLTTLVGDATDPEVLARLVEGADALLDVVGPVRGGPADLRTRIAASLRTAVEDRTTPLRVVALTGAGVRRPEDRPGVVDRLVVGVMGLVARDQLEDGTRFVELLLSMPGVDATAVRAPRLVDGRAGRAVRRTAGTGADAGMLVDRDDLAAELLELVDVPGDTVGEGRTPVASSPGR